MSNPEMRGFEPEPSKNEKFESLVKNMVEDSKLFPEKDLPSGEKMGIIEAIENGKIDEYMSDETSSRSLDAFHSLIVIYEELGKDAPDEELIKELAEELHESV